eukprot:403333868
MSAQSSQIAEFCWQDREIRFDVPISQLQPRKGEQIIDSINSVEDTKGNNGDKGSLLITNLRLIWFSDQNQRINLSVGFECILNTEIKETNSLTKGETMALFLRTKFQTSRYEFIFTSLVKNSPRLFTSFQAVIRSYETTKLYRDLKLRGAIIQDKQVILLPKEQIISKYNGVWNLSAEQGNLGQFILTNVRVVWFAQLAENFNVSLPWVQIKCIKIRESKYGMALVLETSEHSGGYVLGFKVDQLEEVFTEVLNLFKTYSQNPFFGVQVQFEDSDQNIDAVTIPRQEDNLEIIDTGYSSFINTHSRSAYSVSGNGQEESKFDDPLKNIIFSEEIGLAFEKPPNGLSIEQLWKIL